MDKNLNFDELEYTPETLLKLIKINEELIEEEKKLRQEILRLPKVELLRTMFRAIS